MRKAQQSTELQQYFAIKSDLADATRLGSADDIEFHLNELAVIRLHTDSARLRAACIDAMAGHLPPVAAIIA
ncbi:MAG: hypothetical protein PS018_11705 [bacterium]|nr:hypothetical protein [bacterium]